MRFLIACFVLLTAAWPVQAGPLQRLAARRGLPVHIPQAATPTPSPAAGSADPAAQVLLRRMLLAENTLPLSGNQVTLVVRNGLDISSEQLIQRDGTRALRLQYLRPARLAGEQIVDNGRFYAHLISTQDTLEIGPSRIRTLRARVPQVIQQVRSGRLTAQRIGRETVAGHLCEIVQVMARSTDPVPMQKFWIDPTNGAQLRIEQYDASGQLRSASYYTQVTYTPAFDKAAFRLPRSGGKVTVSGFAAPSLTLDQVCAQAGFPVQVPATLPDGYRFQGASVSERRSAQVVEIRYVNGANGLSLFESPDSSGRPAANPQHPRRGVLFGRQSGLKIVIIANLDAKTLDTVLASLHSL